MNRAIGGVTIIVVFVSLYLCIFGVTALSSADADLNYSEKFRSSVVNYYSADCLAQEAIAEIDERLRNNFTDFNLELLSLGERVEEDGTMLWFEVYISDNLHLLVELDRSDNTDGRRFAVTTYKVVSSPELMYEDDTLNLWLGD